MHLRNNYLPKWIDQITKRLKDIRGLIVKKNNLTLFFHHNKSDSTFNMS